MRTIKQCLQETNRSVVLNGLSYSLISDPVILLNEKEHSVEEIQTLYSDYMNDFIERLLKLEPVETENEVVYLTKDTGRSGGRALSLEMCHLDELREDIDAPCYSLECTDWSRSLGYLVADTKLTQDNLNVLIQLYLEDASLYGTTEEGRKKSIEDFTDRLEASLRDIEEERCKSAEEMFDSLYQRMGLPVPERDPEEIELRGKILEAQCEHFLYCRRRERKRILQIESLEQVENHA